MMKLILTCLMLVFSTLSMAAIDRYHCEVENKTDLKTVESLKLPNYKAPVMQVFFKDCEVTKKNANYDLCQVGNHSLIIGINPTKSVLLLSKKNGIEFSCMEGDANGVTEDVDPEVDPDEEECPEGEECEEEQQEQQESEPGHGGSNIRNRGIRISKK